MTARLTGMTTQARKGRNADTGNAGHFASVTRGETDIDTSDDSRYPALAELDIDPDAERTREWKVDFDTKFVQVLSDYDRADKKHESAKRYVGYASLPYQKEAEEDLKKAEAELVRQGERVGQMCDAFDEDPHRRVWVVPNANGHAHLSENSAYRGDTICPQSCYANTQMVLVPEYSGAPDEEVIADAGDRACTFCFEGAPVNYDKPTAMFTADEKADAERKKAKANALAKKKADAAAKAISNPDGTPLRDNIGIVIKTERSAWIAAVDQAESIGVRRELEPDNTNEWRAERFETRDRLYAALMHKTGKSLEEVQDEVEKRLKRRK